MSGKERRLVAEAIDHLQEGSVAMAEGDEFRAGWRFATAQAVLHEVRSLHTDS